MRGTRGASVAAVCAGALAAATVLILLAVSLSTAVGREVLAAVALSRPLSAPVVPSPEPPAATLCDTSSPGSDDADSADAMGALDVGLPPREAVEYADGAILGTSSEDTAAFAARYNELRIADCLEPLPAENFRYESCLEQRLLWIASDPSTDPGSAWAERGAVRSDGAPETGCEGSLAGGAGETGASAAEKWWTSPAHRLVLFRPDRASAAGSCVGFAMVHGGLPDETHDFGRASARWRAC